MPVLQPQMTLSHFRPTLTHSHSPVVSHTPTLLLSPTLPLSCHLSHSHSPVVSHTPILLSSLTLPFSCRLPHTHSPVVSHTPTLLSSLTLPLSCCLSHSHSPVDSHTPTLLSSLTLPTLKQPLTPLQCCRCESGLQRVEANCSLSPVSQQRQAPVFGRLELLLSITRVITALLNARTQDVGE